MTTIISPCGIPQITFDYFNMPEIPTFILCNPNKEELYSLGGISERKLVSRFNSFSELTFRADEYIDNIYMEYYEYITYRRLVYLPETGYFMITEVSEQNDGISKYKEVTCQSLEVSFTTKRLVSYVSGSSTLGAQSVYLKDLLDDISQYIPGWTFKTPNIAWDVIFFGPIWPPSVEFEDEEEDFLTYSKIFYKKRSFDVTDKTVYDLLVTDISESYGCVFYFDTINQYIYIYSPELTIKETDVYISHDNLILNSSIEEITDGIATCLNVGGGNGLDIRMVNPLGNNNIYNFEYYKNTSWMAQDLITNINTWEDTIETYRPIYSASAILLFECYEASASWMTAYNFYTGCLTYLDELYLATVENEGDTEPIFEEWNTYNDLRNTASTNYWYYYYWAQWTSASMRAVSNLLSLKDGGFFTDTQYLQLQPFIIQNTYINDNIIITDSMSASNMSEQSYQLYYQSASVLNKMSEPKYTFTVDSANFMYIKDFELFRQQLCLGAKITLEINKNSYLTPILLEMNLNFDDMEDFSMIFANRLRLDDEAYQFTDLFNKIINTPTTKNSWTDTESYLIYSVTPESTAAPKTSTTETTPTTTNTTTTVISNDAEEMTMNTTGMKVRKLKSTSEISSLNTTAITSKSLSVDSIKAEESADTSTDKSKSTYDPNQFWITGNQIIYTDDGWKTHKTLIGNIKNSKTNMMDPTSRRITEYTTEGWGINPEAIIGEKDIYISPNNIGAGILQDMELMSDDYRITIGIPPLYDWWDRTDFGAFQTLGAITAGRSTGLLEEEDFITPEGRGTITAQHSIHAGLAAITDVATRQIGTLPNASTIYLPTIVADGSLVAGQGLYVGSLTITEGPTVLYSNEFPIGTKAIDRGEIVARASIYTGSGLVVGDVSGTTTVTKGEIKATADITTDGGLQVGDIDGTPSSGNIIASGGIRVGATSAAITTGEIKTDGDISTSAGLYVGNIDGSPSDGYIVATRDIVSASNIHSASRLYLDDTYFYKYSSNYIGTPNNFVVEYPLYSKHATGGLHMGPSTYDTSIYRGDSASLIFTNGSVRILGGLTVGNITTDVSGGGIYATKDIVSASRIIPEGFINFGTAETVYINSIASSIQVNQTYTAVDFSAGTTHDLRTIVGGKVGDILILRSVSSARDVVVKDSTGNIYLAGDCTLDSPADTLTLLFYQTGYWTELSRSNNA